MTGRIGAMSIDGTLISEADLARIEAEEALHAEWQRKAARVVAASSLSIDDCRELLAMLGLGRDVLIEARGARESAPAEPVAAKPARKRRAPRTRAA